MKELPFAFAEDLKGGRGGGGTKESGDLRERKRAKERDQEVGGGREKEKRRRKRGSSVSIAICRIADLRNNNDPSAGGG